MSRATSIRWTSNAIVFVGECRRDEHHACLFDHRGGRNLGADENFLLTGYQVVQKSIPTVERPFAATFVLRWLVNPEEAGEASLAQGRKAKNGS